MTQPRGTPLGSLIIDEQVSTSAGVELYLGRQPALDRWVSVRKLPADQLTDSGAVERFLRGARLGARVIHPNLLQVFDCFALRGEYYAILEQVEGIDLATLRDGPVPIPRRVALSIGLEIARGLAALHARRIAHCALAPERVQISRWGEVKLLDLGDARDLDDESPPGPVAAGPYSAPEVSAGVALDPCADLYSLGAMLHELLQGARPGSGGRSLWGLDPRLALFLRRCLSPSPERRPEARGAIRRLRSLLRSGASDECRAEIAAWLWESRLHREGGDAAGDIEPSRRALRRSLLDPLGSLAGRLNTRSLARARIPLAIGAGIATGVLLFNVAGDRGDTPDERPMPPVSAAGGDAASVSFAVYPWAEISIETGPTFLTPRAAPVELAPGRYEVALTHPRYGVVHRTIEVAPGETKLVRHVFDQVHP
jgi:serine/threonine-protein kinase